MVGQIHCDTFLMRAFAQTISLMHLISRAMKVTKKKRVLATLRQRGERTRTIALQIRPDVAAERRFYWKEAFLLCAPPPHPTPPDQKRFEALSFKSECQKSCESPCSPARLPHTAALHFSRDLHSASTGLTATRPHADTPDTGKRFSRPLHKWKTGSDGIKDDADGRTDLVA